MRQIAPYCLPKESLFSKKFRLFISALLQADPSKRPNAESVWTYEFIDSDTLEAYRSTGGSDHCACPTYLDELKDLIELERDETD